MRMMMMCPFKVIDKVRGAHPTISGKVRGAHPTIPHSQFPISYFILCFFSAFKSRVLAAANSASNKV